jgi:hypothetical protein
MATAAENSRVPVFIFLSDEALDLVNENGIDLVAELCKQGLDVKRGQVANPAAQAGEKEATLVILAIGLAAPLVGIGIAKVIDAIGRNKRAVVMDRRCVPVLDQQGNLVRKPDGQVAMQWEEISKLLEPKQGQEQKLQVDGELLGAKISLQEAHGSGSSGEEK